MEIDSQTMAQNVDTNLLFITLKQYADTPKVQTSKDPIDNFAPLMNLQQCRGVEGQKKRQVVEGRDRDKIRAASMANTNFALENLYQLD